MRVDSVALALRLGVSLFLFSAIVAVLYLVGAAQSFAEETLRNLFEALRWLTWGGLLLSWLAILPAARKKGHRVLAALVLGVGFSALFLFVLVWGVWVYPDAGALVW